MNRVLVIDNYDSFTHNLVQMFLAYQSLSVTVCRSDKLTLAQMESLLPDYLVISPGPGDPANSGLSVSAIACFAGKIPVLGVCLGMQCINAALGGDTVRAPVPVHGKTSRVYHDNTAVFNGLPSPFTAARYHSLRVAINSPDLRVTARSEDGVVMGISHKKQLLTGVQFHPESFMTENGEKLIENFLHQGPLRECRSPVAA